MLCSNMEYPKHSVGLNLAFLFLLLAGALYLCIWSSSEFATPILSFQKEMRCPLMNSTNFKASQDELETALAKASTENKTVIIAVINKAYAEQNINDETTMLDLFINSFWLGEDTKQLLDHLLLVAVDKTAYDRCQFLRLNCYKLKTDGVDFMGEKLYMSEEFIKMMWRRTWFLLEVLKRGYNFIFSDTDVMWLRNPFEKLSKDETEDLQISTDRYLGNPWNSKHMINTGFYFVRSNNKTIALFDKWFSMKDNSTGLKEQDVLLGLIQGGAMGQLGLKVRFLDTLYFSGFCQDSKDFRRVTTVHANCCKSIKAKLSDLRAVLRDWKNFTMFDEREGDLNGTYTFRWTRHSGCLKSWR
ncbi:hypothetical protein TIFTF001_017459 [Ficus carica]|uniref:Nucleotide-diphospho-sugar transferase domain-containing protein n=1 Tax=Ficus carica TaxID=3494 RepID=A0AA88D8C3_FICCA|nr:hypothetical protein TIFTF001_017459 [Ficus carica]